MVFGAFDILHPGHIWFLRNAKKNGKSLIVVIGRDTTLMHLKKKPPLNDENKRKRAVQSTAIADRVILGDKEDPYRLIIKEKPDIICLGYDQHFFVDGLKKLREEQFHGLQIKRLPPFKADRYKSSKIREELNEDCLKS